MVKVVIPILLMVGVVSCSPCRQAISSQRDSVSIELRPRSVIIRDTVYFDIPEIKEMAISLEDSSLLVNTYARSEAIIRPNGELFHTLESLPHTFEAERELHVEVRDSVVYRNYTEIRTVEVERQLSWWQELQIRGFWALTALLSGGLVVRKIV